MSELMLLAVAMLATGIAGGVLAGLLGIGGGIVVVPVLELVLEALGVSPAVRMHIAVATSLAVIIPTSIASARAHHLRGAVDTELARRWAPFIVIGSLLGILIASQVSGVVLSALFGVVALLIAIKLALPLDDRVLTPAVPDGAPVTVIPTSIGAVSSMMGIGGGTFSVMTLTMMNTPIHRAVGTSALFGLLISLPGTLGFVIAGWGNPALPEGNLGFVSLPGFLLIAPTSVLAAPLGVRIAHALSRRTLSALFAGFLLLVAARMLLQTWQGWQA